MKENVVEELQQLQPGDETKQKMLDILRRFHSEEETDSMDEDGMVLLSEVRFKELSALQYINSLLLATGVINALWVMFLGQFIVFSWLVNSTCLLRRDSETLQKF